MRVGNIDGILGMGRFQTVYDSGELSSAQTSLTISNLDGDNDKEYLLICRFVNGYNGAANYYARLNNDSGSNYGFQSLDGTDGTASALRDTSEAQFTLGYCAAQNNISMTDGLIYVKSGYVRTSINKYSNSISTTTVTSIFLKGQSWSNTADNITSLVILADQTNGLGVGSRIILMKKSDSTSKMKTGTLNVQGKVKGTFQKIYKTTLTGAATSVTISGLDGNTDQLYRLRIRAIRGGTATDVIYLLLNNDSGANYGWQRIYGYDSSPGAYRSTDIGYRLAVPYAYSGSMAYSEILIYAKSSYVRTALTNHVQGITGTTVELIDLLGQSWNNTADNLTSMVISISDSNGLGVGTVIELEAYRP